MNFPKSKRLANKDEFDLVFKEGQKYVSSQFILYFKKNHSLEHSRLGVIASRKVGNAVARNRIKRFVRTWFRENQVVQSSVLDLVVIARKRASVAPLQEISFNGFLSSLPKEVSS